MQIFKECYNQIILKLGLMNLYHQDYLKKEGNIRIKQIKLRGTEDNLTKIADIRNYTVTDEDISFGADTLLVTYRISTQVNPFKIIRICSKNNLQ